jgi:uncharacterized protein (DUF302 family)
MHAAGGGESPGKAESIRMDYISCFVRLSFEAAVKRTKDALKRHCFTLLAEIDVGEAMMRQLGVNFRPYLILCACVPQETRRAIEAEADSGSILLCNVVVQQHGAHHIEISAADPAATIGTINQVEMIGIARRLRSLIRQVIGEAEFWPNSQGLLPDRDDSDRDLVNAAMQESLQD